MDLPIKSGNDKKMNNEKFHYVYDSEHKPVATAQNRVR
jgi:hypothetical protein